MLTDTCNNGNKHYVRNNVYGIINGSYVEDPFNEYLNSISFDAIDKKIFIDWKPMIKNIDWEEEKLISELIGILKG